MKMKQIIISSLGLITLAGVAGLLLYTPLIRPWHTRWGATDAEIQMTLPGDEIVSGDTIQTTRSIQVRASRAQIWPWLVQIGQGRGGWYSYDWLENLAGCDIHTLDTIVPELQTLKVGDIVKIGPQKGLPYYRVVWIEPEKALVIRAVNSETGEPGGTWGFYLIEQAGGLTRLVVRHRDPVSLKAAENTFNAVFEPIVFIMEQGMMRGLRDHAETLLATVGSNP